MADKPISLEPTEEQKLRLQLAQRDCELNLANRRHIEAEMRFYQLALSTTVAMLPRIEEELSRLEQEGTQLAQVFCELSEQIQRDTNLAVMSNTVSESKIRIQ